MYHWPPSSNISKAPMLRFKVEVKAPPTGCMTRAGRPLTFRIVNSNRRSGTASNR